jgi:hypothetical protein
MAEVIARNATKSRDGAARVLAISNAHEPGEDSDAEHDYEAWQAIEQGKSRATGFLYDSLEAPPDVDLADELQLRAGLAAARRLDLARRGPPRRGDLRPAQQRVDVAAVLPQPDRRGRGRVDRAARVRPLADRGAPRSLTARRSRSGFDGSKTDDHCALIGCRVSDGYVFTLGVWDPAEHGGEAPRELIDGAVRAAFERYTVSRSSPTCTRSSRTSTSGPRLRQALKVKATRSTRSRGTCAAGRRNDDRDRAPPRRDRREEVPPRRRQPRVRSTSTTRAAAERLGRHGRQGAPRVAAQDRRGPGDDARAHRAPARARARAQEAARPARPCSSSPWRRHRCCSRREGRRAGEDPPRLPRRRARAARRRSPLLEGPSGAPGGDPVDGAARGADDGADRARERLPDRRRLARAVDVRRRLPRRRTTTTRTRSGTSGRRTRWTPARPASTAPRSPTAPPTRRAARRPRSGDPRRLAAQLTAMYGEDPDWPMWALERSAAASGSSTTRRPSTTSPRRRGEASPTRRQHDVRSVHRGARARRRRRPGRRYLDEDDLDATTRSASDAGDDPGLNAPTRGQIAPLMSIQDQIDLTTFGLLVAQWYAAFRQRYVIGWVAETRPQKMKAAPRSSGRSRTTDDGDGGVKVGEFGQTDLDGYIEEPRGVAEARRDALADARARADRRARQPLRRGARRRRSRPRPQGRRAQDAARRVARADARLVGKLGRSTSPTTPRSSGATRPRARSPRPSTGSGSSRRCSASRPRSCGSACPASRSRTSSGGRPRSTRPARR